MEKNKKKFILIFLISSIAIVLLVASATYTLFNYIATGFTESTISVGTVTLHYDEKTSKGHGINITDAFPVNSNSEAMTSNENIFNFKITASNSLSDIHYAVTARMTDGSDRSMGDIVDLYLTEVDNNGNETDLSGGINKFNRLEQFSKVSEDDYIEKVIYTDTVYKGNNNYEKNFRLRMWIDENVEITNDDSSTNYNNKTFGITVNVNTFDGNNNRGKMVLLYGNGTNVGDEILFNDELFYVMDYDSNTGKVTLIPKYVLNVSGTEYVQDPTDNVTYFSKNEIKFDVENRRNDAYCQEPTLGCNVYSANDDVSTDSTIKGYVDNYKQQLVSKGMIKNTDTVRLITIDDLEKLGYDAETRDHPISSHGTAPNFIYNTASYWTGEPRQNTSWDVWVIIHEGELTYDAANANWIGFRPVIEVNYNDIVRSNKKFRYSTWVWQESMNKILASDANMNSSVKMLKTVGINEVYLTILPADIENQSSVDYISKLNNAGIKVYLLYGDPAFINSDNYENVINRNMLAINNFNMNHMGVAYIEGIHYDVEYYLYSENGSNVCPVGETEEARNCSTRKQFVDFVKASYAKAKEYNLSIGHDITAYTTNMASYYDEGVLKNVFDEIVDYSDYFVIMAYGNGKRNSVYSIKFNGTFNHESGGSIEVNKSLLQKLNEKHKDVIVGQELDVFKSTAKELEDDPTLGPIYLPEYEENGHTTYKYTWNFVNRVFKEIEDDLYESGALDVSFAIHDYKQLEELLNK